MHLDAEGFVVNVSGKIGAIHAGQRLSVVAGTGVIRGAIVTGVGRIGWDIVRVCHRARVVIVQIHRGLHVLVGADRLLQIRDDPIKSSARHTLPRIKLWQVRVLIMRADQLLRRIEKALLIVGRGINIRGWGGLQLDTINRVSPIVDQCGGERLVGVVGSRGDGVELGKLRTIRFRRGAYIRPSCR